MKLRLPSRETIGPEECPLFYRWTLLAPRVKGEVPFKVLLHRFIPNRMDADVPHDHPRPFVTLVLRGGYEDWVRCASCNGAGRARHRYRPPSFLTVEGACWVCGGKGIVLGDRLKAPAVRYRPAEHAHMTATRAEGAWTLVVMGPEVRPWGFWRDGQWWPFREFERIFGFSWRCEEPPEVQ